MLSSAMLSSKTTSLKALFSHINPTTYRRDGSGGTEGRERVEGWRDRERERERERERDDGGGAKNRN